MDCLNSRYPDELAWQINLTKSAIKTSKEMMKLKKLLIDETALVNWFDCYLLLLFVCMCFLSDLKHGAIRMYSTVYISISNPFNLSMTIYAG